MTQVRIFVYFFLGFRQFLVVFFFYQSPNLSQSTALCIVGELAGEGSVAVGVGDR